MNYVEYAIGHPDKRGLICKVDDFHVVVQGARRRNNAKGVPLYRSLYELDDTAPQVFNEARTIKAYKGLFTLNEIILDIDKGSMTDEEVFDETHERVTDILGRFEWASKVIELWYSGTGYHITMPNVFGFEPSTVLPETVKLTMKEVFPWADNIFDRARIIRSPFALNLKSNRYKVRVPLGYFAEKLIGCEDVIATASEVPSTQEVNRLTLKEDVGTPLRDRIIHKPVTFAVGPQQAVAKQFDKTTVLTCIQTIYGNGEVQGERHAALLRIASTWKRQGVPEQATRDALRMWASSLPHQDVDRIVTDMYKGQAMYKCHDSLMSKYCDQKCIFYKSKSFNMSVKSMEELEKDFVEWIRSGEMEKAFDLNSVFPIGHPFLFYRGELIFLYGESGIGKSAIMQNIAVLLRPRKVAYISTEVDDALMFRRLVQIKENLTKHEIYDHYSTDTNRLSAGIDHIVMSTSPPSIDDILRIIADTNCEIVIVDVLDDIKVPGARGDNEQTSMAAKALKQLAIKMNIIIFCVHHISKGAAEEWDSRTKSYIKKPMSMHSGKNSSSVPQKADKVIGVDVLLNVSGGRTIKSLKARDEKAFVLRGSFQDFDTFRFSAEGTGGDITLV